MAAALNFAGVLLMSLISSKVADTIYKMVDFKGDAQSAGSAVRVLFAIVLWAVAAWWFGIPTSESHALIAGVTGAAIALGGADGVNMGEWVKVIIGLVLSTVLGFLMGYLIVKLVVSLCRHMDRRKTDSFFKGAQITRRRGDGLYAWRTGWTEVYGRIHAGEYAGKRTVCARRQL